MTAAVTVCVPAFNAATFLAETLESIAAQSFADIKVLISLDRSDDDSESICRRYLHDRRFELIVQRERLGWVGNVNALIERVDTPCADTRLSLGPRIRRRLGHILAP